MNNRCFTNLSTKRLLLKVLIVMSCMTFFAFILYIPRLLDFFDTHTSINIYSFTEMISPEVAQRFEDETGIAVNIKYFQTNEELYAKLRVSLGEGYDVIVASEYMIETLKNENILQKIDHAKLPVIQELDQRLLNQPFDPGNHYSLPLEWHTYGIVYDKQLLTDPAGAISLDLLFKNPETLVREGIVQNTYKICMADDAKEAVMLALLYMFGYIKHLSDEEFTIIEKLLTAQKTWVEAYTSSSLQYFLFSGIVPIALTSSAYMKKILLTTDRFGFQIPKEGSLMVIENLAIPVSCKKIDIVHQFLNFVLSQESAEINSKKFGYNPTNTKAYAAIPEQFLHNTHIFPDDATLAKLPILRQEYPPKKKIESIWLGVKFA